MSFQTCASCGRPTEGHDRHVRFDLPDPVLALPRRERTPGTWMSHSTPRQSVMMQVPEVGAFVRALMPVRLSGGHTITYGVWIGIQPSELAFAFRVWWEPEYASLRLTGRMANTVEPWGLFKVPVETEVRDPEETPYLASSEGRTLSRVLTEEWDHELVLNALGGV